MKQNLITLKIRYTCDDSLLEIVKQYNSVLKFTYNRLLENPGIKTAEISHLQKLINNCELIGSHLKNSAIFDAKALLERGLKSIVFGGKSLFKQRCKLKIDREEFLLKRLMPLGSVGEANQKGNRLFQILNNTNILFKLNKHSHYTLSLKEIGKKRLKELEKLIDLQNNKLIPITYKLDLSYIYLTFDYNRLKTFNYKVKKDRVFGIDLNPNSIGWSVVDWFSDSQYNVIQAGTFSLKSLNDYQASVSAASNSKIHRYINNKRRHEIIEIAKKIFLLCKYYKCETFSVEALNIKNSNKGKGANFNKLVNNLWNRNLLIQQIKKHINSSATCLLEVPPQYSSYLGNLLYRKEKLPDECLASIEISRRGYEFSTQFTFKRQPQQKTVIFPRIELVKSQISLSLEELGVDVSNLNDWKAILSEVKKSKVKYRFSSSEAQKAHSEELFSKFYKQRYLTVYQYL